MFINPPRLSDFKQVLTKAGISVSSLLTRQQHCGFKVFLQPSFHRPIVALDHLLM